MQTLAVAYWTFHYAKRIYETFFVHRRAARRARLLPGGGRQRRARALPAASRGLRAQAKRARVFRYVGQGTCVGGSARLMR